jgi:3-methyladenine DNA glycosylase/8-oxoguanine DNA glycosylase
MVTLADRISRDAVRHFYGLAEVPDDEAWLEIAEAWRPYRMWATVLLHLAWRREQPGVSGRG